MSTRVPYEVRVDAYALRIVRRIVLEHYPTLAALIAAEFPIPMSEARVRVRLSRLAERFWGLARLRAEIESRSFSGITSGLHDALDELALATEGQFEDDTERDAALRTARAAVRAASERQSYLASLAPIRRWTFAELLNTFPDAAEFAADRLAA